MGQMLEMQEKVWWKTSEVTFTKHTFRHLGFSRESTYLVAALVYDHKSVFARNARV